jgi:hypothetical protein
MSITKASGTKRVLLARYARNRRLGDALFLQASAALNKFPRRPRVLRLQQRAAAPPLPSPVHLANRLVGIPTAACEHPYDEHTLALAQANQTNSALRLDRFRSWMSSQRSDLDSRAVPALSTDSESTPKDQVPRSKMRGGESIDLRLASQDARRYTRESASARSLRSGGVHTALCTTC